jgi:dihydroneopterin aldolase / 2-amino-4-hydroxy-6-hydroxymethyldihydropteridine diphosphokinase|tara:strand:+ start:1207 stop:1671 length:465 start_codon:yes stop_codon:yes gene_type:complete
MSNRKSQEVTLGLGSNLGDKKENIENAIKEIAATIGDIAIKSSQIETAPWGNISQENFINCCLTVNTYLTPTECLKTCLNIEANLGRARDNQVHWGPRIIDIDILFYNELILNSDQLIIPHPFLHERDFVLQSLKEICPDKVHPIINKTISELL